MPPQCSIPLIGAVPGLPRILAAYGYGGNGITFSYMASRMLAKLCTGYKEGWSDAFAIDRPAPAR
jgi:glycine/D-amino acid oxidase-like deaminating enzyme